MKSQTSMVYKTQNLPMTRIILESMVNNLGDKIRKMTLDLTFKNKQNKSAFISAQQKSKQRRKAPIELIEPLDIEQSFDQNEQFPSQPLSKSGDDQKQYEDVYVIEETFERSILLREKFMDKLNQIGKRLNVTFRVVPKKVKIIGPNRSLVDEAQDEYRQIQEDICFQPIDNFGKEVYQSSYYSQLLKQNNVEIIPILKRYYFWFLKSKANPRQILQKIFTNMYHSFYPLKYKNNCITGNKIHRKEAERGGIVSGKGTVVLGSIKFTNTAQRITDNLFVRIKARIFEEGIKLKLIHSEDFHQQHLQLSIDKQNLILHMNARQQQQIQKKSIQQQFAKYTFVFLVFSSEKSSKIEAVFKTIKFSDSFKKNKQNDIKDSHILWEIKQGFVCLAFLDHKQMSIQQRIQSHPLFRIINSLPYQLLEFSLGVFDHISLPQNDEFKFTTVQRNLPEKLTLIGLKNMVKSNYEKLAKLFIENKLSSEYWVKQKQKESQSTLNSRTQQIDVSVDLSKVVNESSHMLINDMSIDKQDNRLNYGDEKANKILNNIETECYKFRYEDYYYVVKQSEVENKKKYEKAVDKVEKAKLPYNFEEYNKLMSNATTFKFKTNRISIPKDHMINLSQQAEKLLSIKPELAPYNRQIIVFCGGKECKQLPPGFYEKDQKIKITKIEKNYSIKQGFLLLTNAMFLFQQQADQLPYGKYEALCFLKKLE